ncbi:MAG: pyridoxal-phosphate dependent enzyme [Sandaracinaceae bacterium]|nr:pyridoxal-phosphate dependent enzyme [Sandaracinaceae bacterium]
MEGACARSPTSPSPSCRRPSSPCRRPGSGPAREIWIKRDDRTATRYGGNKVRKLEYVLGEAFAERADTLVTAGAAGSHHALATAIFGAEQGFAVHAALMPQRYSAHVEEQLHAVLATAGAEVHPVPSGALVLPAMQALAARLRLRGRDPSSSRPAAPASRA